MMLGPPNLKQKSNCSHIYKIYIIIITITSEIGNPKTYDTLLLLLLLLFIQLSEHVSRMKRKSSDTCPDEAIGSQSERKKKDKRLRTSIKSLLLNCNNIYSSIYN